ncbi:AMP-binding protein [Streptomyces sp. CH8.1]|uniref:AMP-binding protein n=1 Tax=Streptomyces sp. CH8.1 TaxID=3439546 RepID=UPI003DA1855A
MAPGATVAVTGRDRLDHVVGLLAALRAGATYLPLDREAPQERNRWISADAGAALAYTDGELVPATEPATDPPRTRKRTRKPVRPRTRPPSRTGRAAPRPRATSSTPPAPPAAPRACASPSPR